ncbi:S8 family serine peptidase [Salinibacter altiplanensis]|uniref:S8 family serine peptidase n=1 Tax=Salinibacter altiplanensis TaxID=1803181 RepID=UPI000C9FDB1A|nr:S8 family serine peptidase [Salinibacter altiplanensis]
MYRRWIARASLVFTLLGSWGILGGSASTFGQPSSTGSALVTPQGQDAAPEVQRRVQRSLHGPAPRSKDGPLSPIGADLATLYHQHAADGPAGVRRLFGSATRIRQGRDARYRRPVSRDGRHVTVTAVATGAGGLLSDLRALGLKRGARAGRSVSGRLPIAALKTAAQLSSLRGMVPAYAQTHVGRVDSEADTAHRAFEGRTALDVNGSGQKVCALSDSYDRSATAATTAQDDVASGDLPGPGNPAGRAAPVDVLDDSEPGSDEGRAMLQLIHDLAPGAELGFHTAVGGLPAFVQGIHDLADPQKGDCDILVDDVRYNTQPFFQDGPVANAVDRVVAEGVAYFSSAGNDGQNAYQDGFRDSGRQGVLSSSAVAHDFAPSGGTVDTLQRITIRRGGTFRIFTMQWTDPSSLVEGSRGANTDLDVALVNDTLGVVAQSARDSDDTGLPVEGVLSHTNTGTIDTNEDGVADSTYHLVIEKAAGPNPDGVKYIHSGLSYAIEEYDPTGPTLYGHPMAEGAMAIAAAPFFNTGAYNSNVNPAVLEPFSSAGGIKVRFDESGFPILAPEAREKPDLTATDGIDNTFFGADSAYDSDTHPNFFGTSAAAPNGAAIAALVREATPGLSPPEVYDRLESNAQDVTKRQDRGGAFVSIPSGVDRWSGHGFMQATATALPVALTDFGAVVEEKHAVLTWTTARETNNAGFGVEHKRGDGAFETIGYEAGGGTTSESRTYRHRTAPLAPGLHTFRLRQEDLDGSSSYSREIPLERSLSNTHRVSDVAPNPVTDEASVSVAVGAPQEVRVDVYNVLGQRVARLHNGRLRADDPWTLTVGPGLQSGAYFLRVDGASFTATRPFVRVR